MPPRRPPTSTPAADRLPLRERLAADPEAARLDLPDLVDFMLGTGVRIGEACALRWSAVDLGAAVARIEATIFSENSRCLRAQVLRERALPENLGLRVHKLPQAQFKRRNDIYCY